MTTKAHTITNTTILNIAIAFLGSLFIALFAQISIPFFFVPFTMQNGAVILLAALLGPKRAFYAVLLYLIEGSSGLPFFACAHGGIQTILGPTGGYLLSYLPAGFIVGYLFSKKKKWELSPLSNWITSFLFLSIGFILVLSLGATWLSFFIGAKSAITIGFYNFVLIDLAKAMLITSTLAYAKK